VETGGSVLKSPLGNFLGRREGRTPGALVPASGGHAAVRVCGSTLRDFRDSGRSAAIAAMSPRHTPRDCCGGSMARPHVGERYGLRSKGGVLGEDDPRRRLLELKAQLRRAVDGENFELAAELRGSDSGAGNNGFSHSFRTAG